MAYVNSNNSPASAGGGTSLVSSPLATTTGNFIAIGVIWLDIPNTSTITSVTDTAGNTYNPRTKGNDGTASLQIWYAFNITGNASNIVTINFSAAVTFDSLSYVQYSSVKTSADPFDVEATIKTGSSTAAVSNAMTTAGTGELIVALAFKQSGSSSGSGGSTLRENYDFGNWVDNTNGGGTGITIGSTVPSGAWSEIAAAFLPGATGSVGAASGVGTAAAVGSSLFSAVGATSGVGTAAATAPSAIHFMNDSNIFLSPYNWFLNGSTYAETNCPGAYVKFGFTGTSLALTVDVSINSAMSALEYPAISYSIDGAAATRYQLQSTDTVLTLATGLSAGSHTALIYYVGCQWTGFDRWTLATAVEALRLVSVTIDTGSATLLPPTLQTKRMIVYGNSVLEGQECLGAGVTVAHQDASASFGLTLAACLGAEVGIVGYSGQGYITAGGGGIPANSTAWDHIFAAQPRLSGGLFTPALDYVVGSLGINDASSPASALVTLIGQWRAAAPAARIFAIVPWTAANAANIASAVTTAADTNTFLINTHNTSYDSFGGNHLKSSGELAYGTDLCSDTAAIAVAVAIGSGSVAGTTAVKIAAVGVAAGHATVRGFAGGSGGVGAAFVPQLRLRRAVLPI